VGRPWVGLMSRLMDSAALTTRTATHKGQCCFGTWCYSPYASAAAFLPAMRPWTVHLASPWRLKPPADSPPQ
jgi:hypothetical protein